MTDRIKGFTVILEEPMREDDAEELMNAVRCMRRVGRVEPSLNTSNDYMNQIIAKQNLKSEIYNIRYRRYKKIY